MCEKWYDDHNQVARAEHSNANCVRQAPKIVCEPPKLKSLPTQRTFRAYGVSWDCGFDHPEYDYRACGICSQKRKEAEKKQIFEMTKVQTSMMAGPTDDFWGAAAFQDAVIPEGAGGWMPGMPRDGEERSNTDLNQTAGR
jgi:hypothetical protein